MEVSVGVAVVFLSCVFLSMAGEQRCACLSGVKFSACSGMSRGRRIWTLMVAFAEWTYIPRTAHNGGTPHSWGHIHQRCRNATRHRSSGATEFRLTREPTVIRSISCHIYDSDPTYPLLLLERRPYRRANHRAPSSPAFSAAAAAAAAAVIVAAGIVRGRWRRDLAGGGDDRGGAATARFPVVRDVVVMVVGRHRRASSMAYIAERNGDRTMHLSMICHSSLSPGERSARGRMDSDRSRGCFSSFGSAPCTSPCCSVLYTIYMVLTQHKRTHNSRK